ncbi:MAG: tRNA uridine(34) 5-carboxymethylaminomethyl modification radical SAM/GNAT enzyme Elp3 [Candidatus Gracilibacteria bacterium]|jgi:elongator complex protein 3
MKILSSEDIQKALIQQASNLKIQTEDELHKLKKAYARDHEIDLLSNFKLQKAYEEMLKEGWKGDPALQRLLRKRKVRTLSGVSVITVLTKPYPCPGKCVFCPTEPGMPKSYLSNEPGAMRAVLDDFHPRDQVKTRLDSLTRQGHETDKIEMIVLGGTFSAYNRRYQSDFVRALFNACNTQQGRGLKEAQHINESAQHRIIGLSLETRPDHITEDEIKNMLKLGCTKVQIGIQQIDDEILELNKRGETVAQQIAAIKLLKDAGLKVAVHLMPNLPGSTPEKDKWMVREFFQNPNFKADQLKIYPCVVTPYAELEQWWKEGRYESYSDEVLMDILIEMKRHIPEYVRIERLFRDIPGESILEGSQMTNMRQILQDKMKKEGIVCHCIRCREIKGDVFDPDETELRVLEYEASEGKEFFISFNQADPKGLLGREDKLCSLLRLRFSSYSLQGKPHFIPELEGAALVREVHTYGAQVRVGKSTKSASQHGGLGRRMIAKAEEISKAAGYKKIAIIAGVGTRNYYRKWGYELEGAYMTKQLS